MMGGGEEDERRGGIVCGRRDQSDFVQPSVSSSIRHPYRLCVCLQMKVGKAPGEGWGFTGALLLAFCIQ